MGNEDSPGEIHCYNKGCGKKFDPTNNDKDSCLYHPGPPYFHDAYKIWKCCDKKSTDFSTWLSYKGCTRGEHSGEKPVDEAPLTIPSAKEIRPESQAEVIVWSGLNKPAERREEPKEFTALPVDISEAALKAIYQRKEELMAQALENQEAGAMVGATCKNNSCSAVFGMADQVITCTHHPGVAVFHEGMKYWSCCNKKTSDFSAFLDQQGCATGEHCWIKSEKVDKIREDWFSRSGYIHLNIYCKGAIPNESSFQSDGLVLRIKLIHGFGDKETSHDYELWGEIVPKESRVNLTERKVEIILKQAGPEGWPKLRYEI